MEDISFGIKAYAKILLHAAKYPHCTVNGILIGRIVNGKVKEYVDAVPLFHISINLTPMAEIALAQIDQIYAEDDLSIAGYYVAHENINECSFKKSYHRIADKIAERVSNACLVVVDNAAFSTNLETLAIKVAQHNEAKFKPLDESKVHLSQTDAADIVSSLLEDRIYTELNDFDNHLDDVSKDWRNQEIDAILDKFAGFQ